MKKTTHNLISLTILGLLLNVKAMADSIPNASAAVSPPQGIFNYQNDELLKKHVQFWIRIYSEFTTNQSLIHDAKYPEIIYEVVDLNKDANDFNISSRDREKRYQNKVKMLKDYYTKVLLSIHKKKTDPSKLNEVEKRIAQLFASVQEPNKFFNAAHGKRMRIQLGQKDRFQQGLYYSGRYLSAMEQIFRDKGVPVEITRLPFVESSFNLMARSKVGASGIWQFMRSTGKLYLKINEITDERNDPIRATHAAAELLKMNYESLGSWSLAITAYNHGRKGMMRAVRKIGSDQLSDIIENYRSRSFGFASSNFYAEFLAALEVERNTEKYFGKIERDKPVDFSEFVLNDFIDIHDLSTYSRIPLDSLLELNPCLTENVVKKKFLVPAGFSLRIPINMRDQFLVRYNLIPEHKKYASQKDALALKKF